MLPPCAPPGPAPSAPPCARRWCTVRNGPRTPPLSPVSHPDGLRHRPTGFEHPVSHVASDQRLHPLRPRMTSTQPIPDERFVPKEAVLHGSLAMVTRHLLPLPSPDLCNSLNRSIASCTWHPASSANDCVVSWRNDYSGPACCSCVVNRPRVVSGIRNELRELPLKLPQKFGNVEHLGAKDLVHDTVGRLEEDRVGVDRQLSTAVPPHHRSAEGS